MASLFLSFLPPDRSGFTKLHIFETNDLTLEPDLIETVTNIGAYPNYINQYTTSLAGNLNDWFAIQWEDDKGAFTPLSSPIKGGSTTLVGEIVDRVKLRNTTLEENIIVQEAEATVCYIYNITDPYSVDISTVSKLWLTELTNLTFAACQYLTTMINLSSSSSYSAGIISQSTAQNNTSNALMALTTLEKRSLRRLGIGGSRIAGFLDDRNEFWISGSKQYIDSSRLLQIKAIITEKILVQDIPTGFVISE